MSKVFISYVRDNSEQVQRLAEVLRAHGVDVWLDKDRIKPGYRWADAIHEGISQGDFFIACFSNEYYNSSKTESALGLLESIKHPTVNAMREQLFQ